ncbi:citryl-CoA lyase [Marinobacter sp. SS21]|uniref:citryl-CoA lyase n=1 Tax=Marinobacter sp. SS21 TaxID=2979460 RepID=UPI00232ECC5C|nr:citryl-CoA lyase [Marinobacter sp. SS21]MDC0664283.1 citryl-CoA lyase [Marinobacter sp. SS21]
MTSKYVYHSNFWFEESEESNPFAARACYCSGYDVYGQVVPKAGWFEYLLLLFKGERSSPAMSVLLEKLAMSLANPGPREASVRAAMNGGVAGTNPGSALMAALAVGSGQYGGAREVAVAMELWQQCGRDLTTWQQRLRKPEQDERADIWAPMEHAPGFDPNGDHTPTPVLSTLELLTSLAPEQGALAWLSQQREELEHSVGYPLAMSGVAGAAFVDLGLNPEQGSMLFLILRLPGAAVHALEQQQMGWKKFPFYGDAIELANDPGANVSMANEGADS